MSKRVRAVCVACNGGWMSIIESAVKPVLTPLSRLANHADACGNAMRKHLHMIQPGNGKTFTWPPAAKINHEEGRRIAFTLEHQKAGIFK